MSYAEGGPPRRSRKTDVEKPATNHDEGESLAGSLDTLEEKISLLLARHDELAERCRAAEERDRIGAEVDPVALVGRLQELETENDRLVRHSGFLEDRVRGLLSRVRYVVES